MRKFLSIYLLFLAVPIQAQSSLPSNVSWGHYYSLEQYDRNPTQERKLWDALNFKLIPGDTRVEFIDHSGKENPVEFKAYPELTGNGAKRMPHYLSAREAFNIMDPPANSSPQTKAELNYLLQLQNRRSMEDIRASHYYATVFYRVNSKPGDADYITMRRNLFHIGRSIAPWFCADSLPKTAVLTSNVWKDASYLIWKYKNYFVRIRPYKLEPKLKNLEETNWAAYPSGHATNSYTNAYLFSLLLPEFSSFFLKDAYDMAHSREILGVHYPSDSESGRLLGKELIERLMLNQGFLEDFEKAKAEIHAMKAKHGYL
jgi:acid phosphatase (class A)